MKVSKDFLRFYSIPLVLMIGFVFTLGFLLFYTLTIRTTDGKVIGSNRPKDFTLQFSRYITDENGLPAVTEEGQNKLNENHAWIQILDEDGKEVYCYEKPKNIPDMYHPYQLLQTYQYGVNNHSVFVSTTKSSQTEYIYLVGFPLNISKVVSYIDNDRYKEGKSFVFITVIITAIVLLALTVFYNIMITRNLERICTSLKNVASREYVPEKKNKYLKEIYEGIYVLDRDIAAAEDMRKKDEKAKTEWLANITHDLKTPLAPIRGYAEMLADDGINEKDTGKYGAIILKNALYAEQLVDDLKLTYKLQSNMLPLQKREESLVRFTKEIVIDILNMPAYESRDISFTVIGTEISLSMDAQLMRRALMNVIINALTHNIEETSIQVNLDTENGVKITVSDNGRGMTKEEMEGLFTRYYRGTNMEDQSEGTGLGMAITKQIIEAHGGTIEAESAPDKGTVITIRLL